MKVLVADDEKDLRAVVVPVIEKLGHQVAEVSDGREALDALEAARIQGAPVRILVCDWMMPGLDGLSVVRGLRGSKSRDYTYVILVTGRDCSRQDYRDAMEAGADDFLKKPLDQEELVIRLKVAIQFFGHTLSGDRVASAPAFFTLEVFP